MLMAGGKQPTTVPRPIGYRAEQVVVFTLRYFADHRRLPTQAEICFGLGISTKGEVSRIEKDLEKHGLKIGRVERK